MCKKLIYLVWFILVLSLALASGAKAADPNLVGWWPLNEGAGDIAVDLSGNGNDGTIGNLNGGLGTDGSVWVDDPDRGTVISFNGTAGGAFVRAGDIPQMTLTNDFTWSFWAKHSAENTADNDIILGNRMDENAVDFVPRQFIKFTPTKFEWHMNGNGDDNLDYDDIPADIWLHHAVVKAGDQLTYYRNGIEASSGTFTQPLDFPQPLYFGGDNEGSEGENWSGLMSEVRMYNRALTGLEVLAVVKGVEQIDMEIGYAIKPPVLDGEVDGIWAAASTQSFVPLDDPANASGIWKVLYDAENLYVLVDMTDDSLQNDSASSWQDDSVELYFDGGNTKVNTPLSGDDHQYTFAWTTDEIQGTNIDGYTEGMEHAQVTTDTGWRIEVKMPWLSIQGASPQAGDLVGIDCYYNDDDDGGDSRENKLLSFSAIEGWNDASQWGTAVLATAAEPVDPGTDGLVAFYSLDGDPNDSSGNELHGTLVGDAAFVEGKVGMALDLDGDGDYVDCGNPPELVITEAISIACWVNPAAFVGRQGFAGLDLGYVLKVHEEGRLCFTTPGIADHESSNTILEAGTWQHVAATFLPGQDEGLVFYLNGVETERMTSSAVNAGSGPFRIGNNQWNELLTGIIDEVAIYNRILSDDEILYLAGFRSTVETDPSLVIYYSFDEVGDIVADQSGKGHDGVVVGDVTAEPEGMYNGAANFANGGYLDLDGVNFPTEDIPTSAMTLVAWIKCANTGGDHEIFNARASDETWIMHPEPKSSGDIRWLLRSYGGTTIFQIRAGTMTWDEWLHFAGTYDKESSMAALYINGELIEEMVVENPADIAGDWGLGARVGKTIDDARPFTGLMDEFRMYTRSLSQDEILEVMQGM